MLLLWLTILWAAQPVVAQETLPDPLPAASSQEQYEKINTHLGHHKTRLLFYWTSGIFGHGKEAVPFGNDMQESFFRHLADLLEHVPNITAEIIIDHKTHKGARAHCRALQQKYPLRFVVTLLESRIADLWDQLAEHTISASSAYRQERLEALLNALRNGLEGNPAVASDVARIVFLLDERYPLNMYVDVDTFVENAKKLLLFELFPKRSFQENLIRKDLIKGGISNDLLMCFGMNKEKFDKVVNTFIDYQLMGKERKAFLDLYPNKKKALMSQSPLLAYQKNVQDFCEVLREDHERHAHIGEARFMSNDGKSGLSAPIALLNTCGPAAHKGAQVFEQELYRGEKPSYNSWGRFIWIPTGPLMRHRKLHWLVSYLTDWPLLQKIADRKFLKDLAQYIVDLHDQIEEKKDQGNPDVGLSCLLNTPTDEHNQGAHAALKSIFDEVKAFLEKE